MNTRVVSNPMVRLWPLRGQRRSRTVPASAAFAAGVIALYAAVAIFGEWLAPYSPTDFDMTVILKPPSWAHPLGTDGFGRDVLSRVLIGARSILLLSTLTTMLGVAAGTTIGLVAGYTEGMIDEVVMRLVDIVLAMPGLLLALLILTTVGSTPAHLVVAIAIVFAPKAARIARSAILPLRRLGYVEAARLRGDGWAKIVFLELLPNIHREVAVEFCLRFAYALLLISSLGFLGFGVQPPTPDWGLMISESRSFVMIAPWIVLFPALAIGIIVIAINLLADQLGPRRAKAVDRYV